MKERTKTIINWMIPIIVAGIVLLSITVPRAFEPFSNTVESTGHLLTYPSAPLLGYTTINAINQFAGDTTIEGLNSALLFVMTGIAIILVIAPTFMAFGFKKRENSEKLLQPVRWHLGTGIVIAAVTIGFYSAISVSAYESQNVASIERQHTLAQLQSEMLDLYFNASAKAILPQENGGGGGHFTTFAADNGSTRPIQLSDLNRYDPGSQFDFVISENITDSTITIVGISNLEGNNPDFQNADGSTGHIQIRLTVNPYEDSGFNVRRENEYLYASGQ
ncbi:hypothetical protein [Rhodohalobacter sulfatireducens]|uniref:Uncharacterized protein n=1 Tax=Rhodohalobacter sulfatireducens TaxID=2911366 RepID=A0ABS9KC01_9BACT|nr:hypothetical protein [Rhodohalobacter sulfatireducens]MCG2588377.1 hypothetical protein [Rhodohalobacter sulfatireducens]